jgi:tol-pal system protein YbgF
MPRQLPMRRARIAHPFSSTLKLWVLCALGPVLGASLDALAQQTPQQRSMIELLNHVDTLNADINRLRGELEVLNNALDNAQRRQRDMYLDLDTRLRRLEQQAASEAAAAKAAAELEARIKRLEESSAASSAAGGADFEARLRRLETLMMAPPPAAGPATTPPSAAVPQPTPPTPPTVPRAAPAAPAPGTAPAADTSTVRRAYETALGAYRAGDYQGAVSGFDAFLKRYPRDPLAPNAQYWIGDAWFNLRDFKAAAAAQQALVTGYPDSPKVPDALLNLSSSQLALGDDAAARKTLQDLVARFPQTDAADKARQRLTRMR